MSMNCNGLYLLHYANDQMHMYMIASSVKIINKCDDFAVYWFKSARVIVLMVDFAIIVYYLDGQKVGN